MKFCMLTTFFGSHSFGGDAAFVDRLSRALARHGHEVHVDPLPRRLRDLAGRPDAPPVRAPARASIHTAGEPVRHALAAGHAPDGPARCSRPGRSAGCSSEIRPDVVHFHNLSLIGGPGLLELPAPGAVKLMTAHEHWLVCPLHVLWKYDGSVCETPECVRCCLQARPSAAVLA